MDAQDDISIFSRLSAIPTTYTAGHCAGIRKYAVTIPIKHPIAGVPITLNSGYRGASIALCQVIGTYNPPAENG